MKKIVLLYVHFFCCLLYSYSQQGLIDPSFGKKGIVRTDFGAFTNIGSVATKALTQSDGTIYLIVQTTGPTRIVRLLANGAIDSSYGNNGYSQPAPVYGESYSAYTGPSASIQDDKKIVLAGASVNKDYEEFTVARYNTDGFLDSTFSEDGIQTTDFSFYSDFATSVAIQGDGKIVVAGGTYGNVGSDFALARYNTDGSLDSTFSEDGKQTTDFSVNEWSDDIAKSLAIQADGKIVLAGVNSLAQFTLARYNSDGSPDSTFSEDGKQTTAVGGGSGVQSVALQSDGKIVAGGSGSDAPNQGGFAVARYNTDGTLDTTFSQDGKQVAYFGNSSVAQSLGIQTDGKIVLGGFLINADNSSVFAISRFNTDGALDSTFSNDGTQTTDFAPEVLDLETAGSVAIQIDGKIILAGYIQGAFAVSRYNSNGSLDNSFSKDGKLTGIAPVPNTVYAGSAIQKDGKLVVAGEAFTGKTFDFALARYNVDGTLDTTFAKDGKVTTDFASGDDRAKSVAIQKDGKIVVGGSSKGSFALARYNTDGTLDTTFSKDGKQTTDFSARDDRGTSLAIQADSKIVLVGYSHNTNYNFAVARYNTDGTPDNTFGSGGKQTTDFGHDDSASAVAIQSDGKIVVAGSAVSYKSPYYHESDFALARYNTDGSPDTTFSHDGKQMTDFSGQDDLAFSLALQSDNKIVVAGSAITDNGDYSNDFALARYNTDGSLDTTFSEDGKQTIDFGVVSGKANAVAIENDGKIVAGGSSNGDFAITRLTANGIIDSSFVGYGKQATETSEGNGGISDIAISGDKLYAAGAASYFTEKVGNDIQDFGSVGTVARYSLKGNILPTVTITAPTNNAVYIAPAGIKINVDAADADGTISKVEFYNDSTLINTETVGPYSYKLKDAPAGNYVFTAKVTDNGGLVTTSDSVHVTVIPPVPNTAPTVSIISPANDKTFPAPANIHLEAIAKDPDGTIAKVEFYKGQTLLTSVLHSPYTYTWKQVSLGNYSITAKATDNKGVVTTSDMVNISVVPNIAPSVTITNPANYETFTTTDTIPLIAAAADPDGRIARVEFYSGTTLLRTEYKLPYTYHWSDVPEGSYTITAVAIDNWGTKSTSAAVRITVTSQGGMIVSSRPSSVNDKTGTQEAVSLKLIPNPAKDILNIYVKGSQQSKPLSLSIISASGVLMRTMRANSSSKVIQLDASALASGVYTVKLISGDKVLYKQFVKL